MTKAHKVTLLLLADTVQEPITVLLPVRLRANDMHPKGSSQTLLPSYSIILRPSAPSLHSDRNQWGRNFKALLPFKFPRTSCLPRFSGQRHLAVDKQNLGCENRCMTVSVQCGENRVRVTCMWSCGMAVGVTDRSLNDIKDLHPFCGYIFAHFSLGGTFWSNHVTSLDTFGHEAQQLQLSRGSNTYFHMEES